MRLPVPSPRVVRVLAVVLVLILASVVGWLLWTALSLGTAAKVAAVERQALRDANASQQSTIDQQGAALDAANRRLVEAGEKPVPEPVEVATPSALLGPSGDRGPRGYRGFPGRDGSDGRAGADGRSIAGTPGTDGQDGESIVGRPGPPGPPGESVVGPPGPAGADGRDGQDGARGEPGQSAYPFTFTFVVEQNPAQSTRYTVTCTAEGCTVASEPAA